jgi:hypothetical protein
VVYEYGEQSWNDTDRGKPKTSEPFVKEKRIVYGNCMRLVVVHLSRVYESPESSSSEI